ncbi:MAG: YceI family protein [Terriglobales bacterium]
MKNRHAVVLLISMHWIAPGAIAQGSPPRAVAHEFRLQLDPSRSGAAILLTGNFHSVEGSFALKRGAIEYDPVSGKVSGEVVFDALSGKTGNDGRDKKMQQDVLESSRFPEISFRPDHAEGALATAGDSALQVHGMFSIHGADHELTIPVTIHLDAETWSATAAFRVPYAAWGMKNPSVLFLRVAGFVDVQFHAAGSIH